MLCQIELLAYDWTCVIVTIIPQGTSAIYNLFCLAVQPVLPTARTVFIQLDTLWIVAAVLLSRVVALAAFRALQRDDHSCVPFCHDSSSDRLNRQASSYPPTGILLNLVSVLLIPGFR